MTVKTSHIDTHSDVLTIYRKGELVFVDGMFDDLDASQAWRGIYTAEQARKIANRINQLADIMEGK